MSFYLQSVNKCLVYIQFKFGFKKTIPFAISLLLKKQKATLLSAVLSICKENNDYLKFCLSIFQRYIHNGILAYT